MRRLLPLWTSFLCLLGCTQALPPEPPARPMRWAAYYNDKLPPENFAALDLVVFDRRYHPPIAPLKGKTTVLAYVSGGELHPDAEDLKSFTNQGLIVGKTPEWGSHIMDIGQKRWRDHVLHQVDDAIARGFDGVMLDTIESPLHWARTQAPEKLPAFEAGAVALIEAVRARHPHIKVMLNRGFEVLPEVSTEINYVLAESILTYPHNSTGQFNTFSPKSYADTVSKLRQTVKKAPHLRVFTLDYWNTDDVHGSASVYAIQRANGFIPYVTSRDLTQFTPEPLLPPHSPS